MVTSGSLCFSPYSFLGRAGEGILVFSKRDLTIMPQKQEAQEHRDRTAITCALFLAYSRSNCGTVLYYCRKRSFCSVTFVTGILQQGTLLNTVTPH